MTIRAVDLFAGAGGASTGLQMAARARGLRLQLGAVNHWQAAVDTHEANHPEAMHRCESVDAVHPRDLVPGGKLNLLLAGPECVFFSQAAGGRPIDDQRRSSPWMIFRWLEMLQVDRVLIENVPEMRAWAPLGSNGKPLKSRKGVIFQQYIETFKRYGYKVEFRIINAADYGEAQTRERLFIQAVRGRRAIVWPDPSHAEERNLLRDVAEWRGAREIIDWSIKGKSIYHRKKPLVEATLRRIEEGIRRFGGAPFTLSQATGGAPRHVDRPLNTLATDGAVAFIVPHYGERPGQTPRVHSIAKPLPTVPATGGGKFGLVEFMPFTLPYNSNGGRLARTVDKPIGTVTTKDRIALVQQDGGDILYRLLTPLELAAATGFPADYKFLGTKTDQIKMIGNAWSVRVAAALCGELLDAIEPASAPAERTRTA